MTLDSDPERPRPSDDPRVVEYAGWRTHLVDDPETGGLLVVDPGPLPDAVVAAARRIGTPARVVLTGVSATHPLSTAGVAETLGAPVTAAKGAALAFPSEPAREGSHLWVADAAGALAIVTDGAVYPGQALPAQGPPALPFPGEDAMLRDLVGLVARLTALPPDTVVHPADAPATALGDLIGTNPLLAGDPDDLLTAALEQRPPRPLNADAVVATNRGEADMAWAAPTGGGSVTEMAPAELQDRIDTPWAPLILDVREPGETAQGTLPDSICVPQSRLASSLARLLGNKEIVVVSRTGSRATGAARFLSQVGIGTVRVLAGGLEAWQAAGGPVAH